jgi:transcriptional regulator with XRE-family HTH domain
MDFGSYIRNAREARLLTLEAVAAKTRVNAQLWRDLEANDLNRWPKHEVYRRGFLRAYANAVGLPAEEVLAQFARQFAGAPVVTAAEPAPRPAPAVKRAPRSAALPRLKQFGTRVVLPLGLLIAMVELAVHYRRASAALPIQPMVTARAVRAQPPSPEPPPADDAPIVEPAPKPVLKTVPKPVEMAAAIDPAPTRAAVLEGTLLVLSDPPEAITTVNGVGRGKTPVKVEFLPLGSYTIRVVQPGYQVFQQRVTLDADNPRKTVSVKLRPIAPLGRVP